MGMIKKYNLKKRKSLFFLLFLVVLSGCSPIVNNVTDNLANNLTAAVLNQTDPKIVREGAPAYLLLLDSFIEGSPANPNVLSAAADLYASYTGIFVEDDNRSKILSERALNYSKQALCLIYKSSCQWDSYSYDDYVSDLKNIKPKYSDFILTYSISSLVYIRAHSEDWNAIARLPHIEASLVHYLKISANKANLDSVYTYLGVLSTLRPPALGGDFEKGKMYFEKAIDFSGGENLNAKVEYAIGYARPLYDRELHDQLLNEVIASNPLKENYTLINVLAIKQAQNLIETADDYF